MWCSWTKWETYSVDLLLLLLLLSLLRQIPSYYFCSGRVNVEINLHSIVLCLCVCSGIFGLPFWFYAFLWWKTRKVLKKIICTQMPRNLIIWDDNKCQLFFYSYFLSVFPESLFYMLFFIVSTLWNYHSIHFCFRYIHFCFWIVARMVIIIISLFKCFFMRAQCTLMCA